MPDSGASKPRSLADDLRRWPADRLDSLLRARPDLGERAPLDIRDLALAAGSSPSVEAALDDLTAFELAVLEITVALGSPASVPAVIAAAQSSARAGSTLPHHLASPDDDEAPDTATVQAADVSATPPGTRSTVPSTGSDVGPGTTSDTTTTAAATVGLGLDPSDVAANPVGRAAMAALNTLRDRALLWGDAQSWHPVRAAADAFGAYPCRLYPALAHARPYLRAWLSEPSALRAVIAACSAEAQAVLNQLAWQGPVMQVPAANRLRETGIGPVADLLRAGLLLAVDESSVAIPREVALHLRSGVWLALPSMPIEAYEPDVGESGVHASHAAAALAATQDALRLLRALHTFHPKVGKGGQLSRADAARLASHLGWSPEHLLRWLALAMAADLVGMADSADEVIAATRSSEVWLESDPGSLWWHLAQALLAQGGAVLCAARTGTTDPAQMSADDLRRGALAMRAWLNLASLGVPVGDIDHAWSDLRPRLASHHPALAQEARDIAAILGIACAQEPSGLATALLTGREDRLRSALEAALPPEVSSAIVQPDHTVIAPGRLRPDLRQTLLRFSELVSEDQALVVRITAAKVREAITLGMSAHDITDFLGTLSQTPTPQSLAYMIADCAKPEAPVTVEPVAAIVRAPSAAEAQRLLAEPRLARLGLVLLGDQTLVSRESAQVVFEALRSAGVHLSGSMPRAGISGRAELRAAHGWVLSSVIADISGIARSLAQPPDAIAQHMSLGDEWEDLTLDGATSLLADCLSSQRPIHVQLEAAPHEVAALTLVPLHIETDTATVYDLTHAKVRTITISKIQRWAPAA